MKDLKLYESIPSLENNFAVKFRAYETASALVPHWHEHVEMMFITDGECDFHVGGRSYRACSGDLMIVNSAEIHSFTVKGRISFYSLLLFPSFFEDVDGKDAIFESLVRSDAYIRQCFFDMYSEYTSGEKFSDMMLKSAAYRLVGYLGRGYSVSKSQSIPDTQKLKRLYTVLEYISASYRERITTRELASLCFISEEHFCRFFKSEVGKTVTEYINQYRTDKAAVLLSETDDTIGDIGASVGFSDVNYFSRIFKKINGVTPGEYRKRCDAQRRK